MRSAGLLVADLIEGDAGVPTGLAVFTDRAANARAFGEMALFVMTPPAQADEFATAGRLKPPGVADPNRHPGPEFSPPSFRRRFTPEGVIRDCK
jgi:hypothetical protein